MSTALIVATTAATNANIAAINANMAAQSHAEQCQLVIDKYDSKNASTEAMQSYAECVQYLHPKEHSNDILAVKALVIVLLLSTAVGGIRGAIRGYDEAIFDGLFIGGLVGITIDMLIILVAFLFS
jgi:hypothetical protein